MSADSIRQLSELCEEALLRLEHLAEEGDPIEALLLAEELYAIFNNGLIDVIKYQRIAEGRADIR